jgi:hypothetical protein
VTLGPPEDALEAGVRRRPFLLGIRVVLHGDDRA